MLCGGGVRWLINGLSCGGFVDWQWMHGDGMRNCYIWIGGGLTDCFLIGGLLVDWHRGPRFVGWPMIGRLIIMNHWQIGRGMASDCQICQWLMDWLMIIRLTLGLQIWLVIRWNRSGIRLQMDWHLNDIWWGIPWHMDFHWIGWIGIGLAINWHQISAWLMWDRHMNGTGSARIGQCRRTKSSSVETRRLSA